jgi:cysteine-S-conjugate beta-lyase
MSTRPEGLSTRLIHHEYQAPEGFAAPQVSVHKASTVIFPNTAALHARDWKQRSGYTYGLHGTPTTFTLEERIATLEGGLQTVLVPSGLAAIALADMALLKTGDELLIPENSYGPNKELARVELAAYGISHRFYDATDAASLAAAITPATRMVWLEAAGSITMEFPDLPALIAAAKTKGVLTALDNTWGAGVAFDAFALGVDLTAHALTKFPSGGGDVLMGAVTTRDEALHLRLKGTHMRMGWGVAGNDAEAVLRGLPSMALRYRAGDEAARRLAQWFQTRPEIQCVLHPALPGAPGHEHWKKLCTQAAGLFSVVFQPQYTSAQVHAFVDALRRFKIGYSWAGPVSLAVPYDLPALRKQPPWKGGLVRFSMGLEEVEDLIADCEAALAALHEQP